VSGAKDKRPALDQLVADARRGRFDVLVVWRLDRLGRNLRQVILLLDELNAVGVPFVSLGEGIDTATLAGRLQLHILGAHCGVRTPAFRSASGPAWHRSGRRGARWVARVCASLLTA
jgi:Resolvase, N terminal domain